jgi:hypothetical protein
MKRLSIRAIAVNRRRQTLAASTLQQYGSRFRGSLWEILNLKPQSPEGQQFFRHYLTIEKHLLPDGVTTPSAAMPDGKWNDLRSLKNALSLSISLT